MLTAHAPFLHAQQHWSFQRPQPNNQQLESEPESGLGKALPLVQTISGPKDIKSAPRNASEGWSPLKHLSQRQPGTPESFLGQVSPKLSAGDGLGAQCDTVTPLHAHNLAQLMRAVRPSSTYWGASRRPAAANITAAIRARRRAVWGRPCPG